MLTQGGAALCPGLVCCGAFRAIRFLTFALTVLAVCISIANSQPTDSFESPRELLAAYGVDDSHLRFLVDDRPLHADEDETLLRILYHLPRLSLLEMHHWRVTVDDWSQLAREPEKFRAQAFRLYGRVTSAERRTIFPELFGRFQFRHYYVVSFEHRDSDHPIIVCTRRIPESWQELESLSERASFEGLFLKTGGASRPAGSDESGSSANGAAPLIFAADRVAWYPQQTTDGIDADQLLLANAGMDFGLFEDITHKTRMKSEDRECFYQMLDAVGKIDPKELAAALPTKFDMAAMLEAPETQEGHLIEIQGAARRAVRLEVDDPDIRERFGIDHYYEIEVFRPLEQSIRFVDQTDDGKEKTHLFTTYPFVFCALRLPEGMPTGEAIHETVRIRGFYCKLWAYKSQFMSNGDSKRVRLQRSPLLVGLEPIWIPSETRAVNPLWGILGGAIFIAALLGVWYGLSAFRREDEQASRRKRAKKIELPDELG